MKRLVLYNHPITGRQFLANVFEVSSECEILWDELVDGPFPPSARPFIGWLARSGDQLIEDPVKQAEYDAEQVANNQQAADHAALNSRILDGTATLPDIRDFLRRFI